MALFEAPSTYPPCPTPFSDHIYKTVHGVSLPLRIWPSTTSTSSADAPSPYLIWFHGGGFLGGQHARPNLWVVPGFRARGFHVISVAYRFAPQVHLRDIFGDINDAYIWLRSNLPSIVGEGKVDLDRYAVGGDSAGGVLATLAGHKFSPPPKAVLDDCGPTDWLMTDYKGSREPKFSLPSSGRFSDAQIQAALVDHDPGNAEYISVFTWHYEGKYKTVERLRDYIGSTDYVVDDRNYLRSDLFVYSACRGLVARLLFQVDSEEGVNEHFEQQLREWSSFHLLEGKKSYPPTFFIHGTDDPVVPVEQSKKFAKRLAEMGVEYQEGYKEGASHVFEEFIWDENDPIYAEIIIPALDFITKHV